MVNFYCNNGINFRPLSCPLPVCGETHQVTLLQRTQYLVSLHQELPHRYLLLLSLSFSLSLYTSCILVLPTCMEVHGFNHP